MTERSLRQVKHAVYARLKRAMQLQLRYVPDVFIGMLLASVIDQNVQTAECGDSIGYTHFTKCRVADIASQHDRLPPFVTHNLGSKIRVVMLV